MGKLSYMNMLRFETDDYKKSAQQNLMKARGALGELYRLGITSLIQGASDVYSR